MVLIPAGEFVFGVNPDQRIIQFMSDATLALNAQPAQRIHLKAFFIDLHEVTYEAFRRFKPKIEYDIKGHREPIRGVSWYEAEAYCLWLGKRLPTEIEWERPEKMPSLKKGFLLKGFLMHVLGVAPVSLPICPRMG